MLITTSAYVALLIPAVIAVPASKRQNTTTTEPETYATARATLGGANDNNPVTVIGTVDTQLGLDKYFNIPFARPPVGDLRFAPPKPAEYKSTIDATVNGPACLQATPDYATAFGDLVGPYGASEDCLQLNIFVPRDVITIGTGMPVLVFVHGGGFFGGSANSADGSVFVSTATAMGKPLVYVTVQYRVGVLGFPLQDNFAQGGLTNLGLKDVKLALQWVQKNINSFRGDPTKVTVAGHSAGAALTGLTHLWPDYNLYRSSIMMSGSPSLSIQNTTGLIDTVAKPAWDALLQSVDCGDTTDTIDCLRSVNGSDLVQAQNNLSLNFSPFALYGPTVDGDYIPDSPYTLLADGAVRKVPFIISNTKDEGTGFAPRDVETEEEFRAYVRGQRLPPLSNETVDTVAALWPDDPSLGAPFGTGNETFGLGAQWKRAAAVATDALYTAPRRHFATSLTDIGVQGWSYRWDENDIPNIPAELGAFHGSDIVILSGLALIPGLNYTKEQQALTISFMSYIANFVHFSSPNGASLSTPWSSTPDQDQSSFNGTELPAWPSYLTGNIVTMSSSGIAKIADDYRKEQVDFLNSNEEIVSGY